MSEVIQMTKDELTKLMSEVAEKSAVDAVEKAKSELTKTANKFALKGSAHEIGADALSKLEGKEKTAKFLSALYNKDANSIAMFKSLTEGTNANGGFLVPEEFASEVNRVVEDYGLIAKLSRKFPMNTDTLNVPRLASSVTIYYAGETGAGTASQPVFENVQLLSKTAIGLTPMSNELLADANVSVVDLLIELFAEAIAGDLDLQGLVGSGTFTGILADTGVTIVQPSAGNSTFTLCSTVDNMRDLIANVKPWSLQGAGYIMHRTIWALLQKQKASTAGDYIAGSANPILTGSAMQGFPTAQVGVLWGYPVYLSDKMPSATAVSTKYVIFGNLKHVYIGMRQEMAVSISSEGVIGGVSLFETNQSAVRVITRHAVAVGLPTAFAVLKTSAT